MRIVVQNALLALLLAAPSAALACAMPSRVHMDEAMARIDAELVKPPVAPAPAVVAPVRPAVETNAAPADVIPEVNAPVAQVVQPRS